MSWTRLRSSASLLQQVPKREWICQRWSICVHECPPFRAEAALQRVDEVDVEGGWKTGASYVCFSERSPRLMTQHRVPYAALAKTFGLIEATTKRLEKTAILTAFLFLVIQRSTPGNHHPLLQAIYLCINRVRPNLPSHNTQLTFLALSRL